MNVTLFAPYQHCETTWAALVLADCLERLGCSVRWAAAHTRLARLHQAWDNRVYTARADGLRRALCRTDCLISFVPAPAPLYAVARVVPSARCLYVLCDPTPAPELRRVLACYHHVVCPTRLMHARAGSSILPHSVASAGFVSWIDWGCLGPVLRRTGASTLYGGQRLLILGDADNCKVLSRLLVSLRHRQPVLRPQLVLIGRPERRALRMLPAGVSWSRFSLDSWAAQLRQTDLMLSVRRTRFGGYELESLCNGVPVLSHDVEPLSSMVIGLGCGAVTPCAVNVDWLGGQTAVAQAEALANLCSRTAGSSAFLAACRANDWRLAERQRRFSEFWQRTLDPQGDSHG